MAKTKGQEQDDTAFLEFWKVEMAARYPFYNEEMHTSIMYSARRREDRRVYDAGMKRGLELRGCCEADPELDG